MLVIGGGITGAGVALDAASRGLRTALVERDDFASGTSSRSSKFVRGGLRYLRSGDYGLVVQSVAEQRRLLHNAPHLVHPVAMVLPVDGRRRRVVAGAVLALHDLAAGTGLTRPVRGGVVFHEAQVDDARLTLAVVRTAVLDHGAVAVNRCPVVEVAPHGVVLGDGRSVQARVVVNATGVWADGVRALEGPAPPLLRPSKGVHVVVARDRVRLGRAGLAVPDGKGGFAFVTPWEDRVLIGTTDTPYDGGPVECTPEDVALLLAKVNPVLDEPLTPDDVLAGWAGLRPLVDGGDGRAEAARSHLVTEGPGGMVTVVGGKLTTYRRMAADTVDLVCRRLGRRLPCRTARLRLRGGGVSAIQATDPGKRGSVASKAGAGPERLWRRYGSEAAAVSTLAAARPGLDRPLVPGLPYLRAEAVWAVREEMALTLDDVLSRRTRATILDRRAAAAAAPEVAALLAPELGWSEAETQRQVASYLAAAPSAR